MTRRATHRATSASVLIIAMLVFAGVSGCSKTQTTAELLSDAANYQQKGDTTAALIQLKNAATQSPQDGEVRMRLAELYLTQGDAPSAEKELRRAATLGVPAARTAPLLVRALVAQNKAKEALSESDAANATPSPELTAVRGTAFLLTGQPDKAAASFDKVIAVRPKDVTALLGKASLAASKQDYEAARLYSDEAIAADPKSTDALLFRVSLQRSKGEIDAAIATLSNIIALEPKHRSAYLDKASLEISVGKYDAAKADIASAAKITPGSVMLAYLQSLMDFKQGHYQASLDNAQKVLRVAPDQLPTLFLAGSSEAQLGSYEQAERHFRAYLQEQPDFAPARTALAALLLKVKRADESLGVLEPMLKNADSNAQVLTLAGQAYLMKGEYAKANGYFAKAIALMPKQAPLHTAMALSKLATGDAAAAQSELLLATSLDPTQEEPAVLLATTEMRLGHQDKAMAAADALLKASPDSAVGHDLKGRIYAAQRDNAKAFSEFDKALAAKPDFFTAAANGARLAIVNKQPDLAKKRLEAFLEKNKKSAAAMSALADLATSQGKPEEALAWLEKANAEQPESIPAGLALGSLYLRQNTPAKAEALARKLQVANPTNAAVAELLGQSQAANGNLQGALDSFSKLAVLVPKSAQAQYRIAAIHSQLNNDAAAEEDLKKAVALQPNYFEAQAQLARLALKRGDAAAALSIARQLQRANGQGAAGHILEGDIQMAQKKPELASEQYKLALSTANSAPLAIKLYQATVAAGKAKAAEDTIAQWQKAHPDDILVPMFRAEATLASKDLKGAEEQFEALAKRAPNNVAVLNNLAWVYQQRNDPRALPTAEKANSLAPRQPQVMDTLGWILVQQNDKGRGLPILQKAASLAPQDATIRAHLASATGKAATPAKEK